MASQQPCKFFKTPAGCKNGAACQYLHADCKFFLQGHCRQGSDCPFRHGMAEAGAPPLPGAGPHLPVALAAMELGGPPPPPVQAPTGGGDGLDAAGLAQARLVAVSQAPRAFALDCEFIQVRQGKGGTLQHFSVTVSVGVVSECLETILYARVKQPPRTQVFDDAFARTQGKLEPDWGLGVRLEVAQELVRGLLEDGQSVLIGWQVGQDLEGLRLPDLYKHERVLDLSDHILTTGGAKCQLGEAYRAVFLRDLVAHDACDDAKMTMELYSHWRRAGMAPIRLPMSWYYVHWKGLAPPLYDVLRWDALRPEKLDRDTCREEEVDAADGGREYRLRFRRESDRVAYFNLAKRRLVQDVRLQPPGGPPQDFPQFLADVDGQVGFPFCAAVVYKERR